uniref:Uncharacterized protein n=1 Tax=Sipha flava TaxID=143950 RepID=A0A2S2Q858_9HEMI
MGSHQAQVNGSSAADSDRDIATDSAAAANAVAANGFPPLRRRAVSQVRATELFRATPTSHGQIDCSILCPFADGVTSLAGVADGPNSGQHYATTAILLYSAARAERDETLKTRKPQRSREIFISYEYYSASSAIL